VIALAAPAMLYALALLLPVTAAFLFRRRRDALRVPSVLLWRLQTRARSRSKRMRNLKRLAALAMCIFAVAALVFAAARPILASRGRTVIAVVDVSASMAAGKGNGRPIAQARAFLEKLAATAGPRDSFVVIAAGGRVRRAAGPMVAGPALDEALAALVPEAAVSDLGEGVTLAGQLAGGLEHPHIVVLTDGGKSATELPPLAGSESYSVRVFAPSGTDNLGIAVLATRPPADARSDDEREALAIIGSSSDRPRAAKVTFSLEGATVAERRVTVLPKGEVEVRAIVRAPLGTSAGAASGRSPDRAKLSARVEPDDGLADVLTTDDEVATELVARPPPRVLLVSDGSERDVASAFFAEKALLAAGAPKVEHVTPDVDPRGVTPADLVVALTHGPVHSLDAPAIYLGTRSGALPFAGFRDLDATKTALRSLANRDPLLRGVALDGVTMTSATAIDAPSGARALVDLDGGSVILAGGAGASAWVFFGIDPAKSDLVLRVAFPVLMANAVASLSGASDVLVADGVPRAEIALTPAPPRPPELALAPEPEPSWRLPVSPAALLALVGTLLLAGEAWMFRRGWAT
jgi:hypothetical protein